MTAQRIVLPVSEVIFATPRARRVLLDLDGRAFPFAAGQAVELGTSDQPLVKPYSIASAPAEAASGGRLEFLVQYESETSAGVHLEGLAPGRRIAVVGPAGSFVLPDPIPARPLLFVAGGTGIAPVRSMLRAAVLGGHREPMALLFSAREAGELAYWDEFRALEAEGRLALRGAITRRADPAWTGWRGRIDRARLSGFGVDPASLCFLCGPSSLIDDLSAALESLGVARDRIRHESWRTR